MSGRLMDQRSSRVETEAGPSTRWNVWSLRKLTFRKLTLAEHPDLPYCHRSPVVVLLQRWVRWVDPIYTSSLFNALTPTTSRYEQPPTPSSKCQRPSPQPTTHPYNADTQARARPSSPSSGSSWSFLGWTRLGIAPCLWLLL
jgi:hypothetical protein